MAKRSAGLLLFRRSASGDGSRSAIEVLLAHPGGPFWERRDLGAWMIPKGECEPGEDPLATAMREFREEIGHPPPDGPVIALGEIAQSVRKVVTCFAVEGDFDPILLSGDQVEMEWPPRSGKRVRFPEIDRVAWFAPDEARQKILTGQLPLLDRLAAALSPVP